ncbi:MAG TPA: molybdopterin-dependent oxidoreductase [Trebonia sp.]
MSRSPSTSASRAGRAWPNGAGFPWPIEQMRSHLTMLAYEMNGAPLSYGHGAPLRLRNEIQLGFKQVKWLAGIDFVASFADVGGGHGGYNPDHEFFGYSQSI